MINLEHAWREDWKHFITLTDKEQKSLKRKLAIDDLEIKEVEVEIPKVESKVEKLSDVVKYVLSREFYHSLRP